MTLSRKTVHFLAAVGIVCIILYQLFAVGIWLKKRQPRHADKPWFGDSFWLNDEEVVLDNHYRDIIDGAVNTSNKMQQKQNGNVYVRYGSFERRLKYDANNSVTIATHTTIEHLGQLVELVKLWDGPISVAVYAPGDDFYTAYITVLGMRECSRNIKENISFYLFYHKDFPPTPAHSQTSSFTSECIPSFSQEKTFLQKEGLKYPAAKARNIARQNCNSRYILTMDIEFLPNRNDLMKAFIDMTHRYARNSDTSVTWNKRIYVLPVFEVKTGIPIPATKQELIGKQEA